MAHVVATDLTPEMVEKAVELAAEQTIRNIAFFRRCCRGVTICRCFVGFGNLSEFAPHHFQDVRAFLSEVHRVLRTDGLFCMTDSVSPESEELRAWQNRVERLRDNSHVYGYPPSQWDVMITDAGFSLEKTAHSRNAQISFLWWVRPEKKPARGRAGDP